jgi:hypothetical protein
MLFEVAEETMSGFPPPMLVTIVLSVLDLPTRTPPKSRLVRDDMNAGSSNVESPNPPK